MAEEQPVIAAPETANANQTEQAAEQQTEQLGSEPTGEQAPVESTAQPGPEPADGKEYQKLRQRAQEAEREREYWRGRAENAKAPETKPPVVTQGPTHEPIIDEFENYDDFVVAKAEYKILHKQREQERQRVFQAQETAWGDRLKKAVEKIPDLPESLRKIDQGVIPWNDAMALVVKDSEVGPNLADYLVKNPGEARRLANLNPVTMAREMGKLEVKLTSEGQKPNKITQAPEPIKPVGGKGQAVMAPNDYEKMSVADFMRSRNDANFVKAGNRLVPKR